MVTLTETAKTWLIANTDWLVPLGTVLTFLAVVWSLVTGFWTKAKNWIVQFLRKKISDDHMLNTKVTLVLNAHRTLWNMASRDGKPCMQIMTAWYATNASDVSIRILDAGLIKPSPKNRTCVAHTFLVERQNNWAHDGMSMSIQPNQTENLEATFFLDPPTQKENESLVLKMYVVDQYGRKHVAPRIKIKYMFPSAETF